MILDKLFKRKIQTNNDKDKDNDNDNEYYDKNNDIKNKLKVVNSNNYDDYILPSISLLDSIKKSNHLDKEKEIKEYIFDIENTFKSFKIIGKIREVYVGPIYTRYEIELSSNTKISSINSIKDNLMLSLGIKDLKIVSSIGKKGCIAIDIENNEISTVSFREVICSFPKQKMNDKLMIALGKDMIGVPRYLDLEKTSNVLIGGATGTGKSVFINDMICSVLMRARPDEVKMVLIDTKRIELSVYNGIPHLLQPVVTDPRKATIVLQKIVSECMSRIDLFSKTRTKNIEDYNYYIENLNKIAIDGKKNALLPHILVIIDEIYDLTYYNGVEVNDILSRISQLAKDTGIHLIIGSQRPSADIVSSLVKSSLLTRVAFKTVSKRDSSIILDNEGAQDLTANGDMLFLPFGEKYVQRIKCCYIKNDEILRLVDFITKQYTSNYEEIYDKPADNSILPNIEEEKLYEKAVEFVVQTKKASASLLQRKFKIGYNRAARLIDLLEERGIIGPQQGSKPREVMVEIEKKS